MSYGQQVYALAKSFVDDMENQPRNPKALAEDIAQVIQDAIEYEIECFEDRRISDCTCRMESVTPTMVSPPERMIYNRSCPVHGDPDYIY